MCAGHGRDLVVNMALTVQAVEKLFQPLVAGDSMAFFTDSVDDNVVWTIANPSNKTCILSGKYDGKMPTAMALSQLSPYFTAENPARTSVEKIFVSGDHATVFVNTSGTSSSGHKLHDRAAWVVRIAGGKIVECDSFADTAAINDLVKAQA